MSNDTGIAIELTNFFFESDHVRYSFVLHNKNELYYCSFRYSELFALAKKLNTKVKHSLLR
jgi:hypothetical protein